MTVYLDCNATTPVDPEVADLVVHYLTEEFGNEGSRTHEYGARARSAVNQARSQVAAVVDAALEEVIFTSGATESDNLAVLGLRAFGQTQGRRHIVSTQIEHKAVLEPLAQLAKVGFEVDLIPPNRDGRVDTTDVLNAIRDDTLLVSVMHVNNETGVIQPVAEIADGLQDHEAYLHVDAAQGFGKDFEALRHSRIDLISVSGHKIYAPKGVGALIARRRGYRRPPIEPLQLGGGQERGLRPGTLPVHLIVGLGKAAELAQRDTSVRAANAQGFKEKMLQAFSPLAPLVNGDPDHTLPNAVSLTFPGIDAEAAMVSLKGLVAVSNGSACTSSTYEPSHVLRAMGLTPDEAASTIRFSWCHLTPEPDWQAVVAVLGSLQ